MKKYTPDDPVFTVLGRTDDARHLWWSGAGVRFCFQGSTLAADVYSTAADHAPWLGVLADGAPVARLPVAPGPQRVVLLAGMDPQVPHQIQIIRDTQSAGDETEPLRLDAVWTDGQISRATSRMLLEFIGDSLTVGEGTVGPESAQEWRMAWMCHMKAFPTLVAEGMQADKRVIAVSGWGAAYSWDGNAGQNLGRIYPLLCGIHPCGDKPWPQEEHPARAVVINLGTNDASAIRALPETEAAAAREHFQHCVRELLGQVRSRNANAYILWTLGLLGDALEEDVKQAVSDYQREHGDRACGYLHLSYACKLGSRQHPGEEAHRIAAQEIIARLQPALDTEGSDR